MTDVNIVYEIRQLPDDLQQEAFDFVLFLKSRLNNTRPQYNFGSRKFGISKGKYKLTADFDEPLEDFQEYMQ